MRRWHVLDNLMPSEGVMVELGIWKGATMKYLVPRHPKVQYYGVDLYEDQPDNPSETYIGYPHKEYLNSILDLCIKYDHAHMLVGRTVDAALSFQDEGIDLIFIDADHSYDGVMADIRAWMPKMKPGSIMAGHDYGDSNHPGVKKAVDEVFGPHARFHDETVWSVQL